MQQKCQICSILHIDASTKLFNLDARSIGNRSMKVVEREFIKCIVLCHNCHSEEHNPHLSGLL